MGIYIFEVKKVVETALKKKLADHKEKVGSDKTKQTTLRKLKIVFNRGIGAYKTNPGSVRPNVKSPEQWAFARCNSYLYALRNGRYRSGKHDTDLLPPGHPQKNSDAKDAQTTEVINRTFDAMVEAKEGKFYINAQEAPDLVMVEGETYVFDISHESLEEHPLAFSTVQDGTHGGGDMYTKDIARSRDQVVVQVTNETPDLFYFCPRHSGMGGSFKRQSAATAKKEILNKTYSDYPQAATNNAKRALKYVAEHGWGSCGTAVGKQRASQLANREPLSRDTIARMSAFKRHQQNKDVPYGEGCGGLMWDCWGGSAGINWANKKLKEIDGD